MRSACVLEWLAQRYDVYALVFAEPGQEVHARCRRVEVVELPAHSRRWTSRAWRNLNRACRGIPPLVDRFFCREARAPLEALLEEGPFELAVFEHFWSAPWIGLVRPHCRLAILDLHNREPEFCRAMGGPLAAWFARSAARWEKALLPQFDQVWDTDAIPTGLREKKLPQGERVFDVALSGTWAYPPNRDALRFFFSAIWPRIVARRPKTSCAIIGKNPEAVPPAAARDARVYVTGPVADAAEWLARAKVAAAPLRRGAGACVKIAEAWQAGCAVVATAVGARGYPAKRDALLLANSPEDFATAVLRLLENDPLRDQVARAGRERFEREYSWPAVHARMDSGMGIGQTSAERWPATGQRPALVLASRPVCFSGNGGRAGMPILPEGIGP